MGRGDVEDAEMKTKTMTSNIDDMMIVMRRRGGTGGIVMMMMMKITAAIADTGRRRKERRRKTEIANVTTMIENIVNTEMMMIGKNIEMMTTERNIVIGTMIVREGIETGM